MWYYKTLQIPRFRRPSLSKHCKYHVFWRVPWKCSPNVGFGPIPWGVGGGLATRDTEPYIYMKPFQQKRKFFPMFFPHKGFTSPSPDTLHGTENWVSCQVYLWEVYVRSYGSCFQRIYSRRTKTFFGQLKRYDPIVGWYKKTGGCMKS